MWLDHGRHTFWKVNEPDIYKHVYIGVVLKKKRISIMQACQLTQYIMNINLQNKKNKIKEEAHGPHRSPQQQSALWIYIWTM